MTRLPFHTYLQRLAVAARDWPYKVRYRVCSFCGVCIIVAWSRKR